MTIQQMLLGASSAAAPFIVDAADFDGTNDYLSRASAFTGQADSKSGILSVWVRFDVDPTIGVIREIFAGRITAGPLVMNCNLADSAPNDIFGAQTLDVTQTPQLTGTEATDRSINTWYHLLWSWDGASTVAQFYINDTAASGGTVTSTNVTSDYSHVNTWSVGVDFDNAGTTKWDGGIAEFYFAPNQYLDMSVVNNRRLFISAAFKPVNLGATGSTPTGSAPMIYLHLDDAEAAANFATNRTGNGNFTVTGALTTYASSPSD